MNAQCFTLTPTLSRPGRGRRLRTFPQKDEEMGMRDILTTPPVAPLFRSDQDGRAKSPELPFFRMLLVKQQFGDFPDQGRLIRAAGGRH